MICSIPHFHPYYSEGLVSNEWGWDFQTIGDGGEPLHCRIYPVSILSNNNHRSRPSRLQGTGIDPRSQKWEGDNTFGLKLQQTKNIIMEQYINYKAITWEAMYGEWVRCPAFQNKLPWVFYKNS